MSLQQFQVYLVRLDPTIGTEIQKTRPCVIISPNEMNGFLQTVRRVGTARLIIASWHLRYRTNRFR